MFQHRFFPMQFLLTLILFLLVTGAKAQQPLQKGGMSYVFNPKPNSIIYHDSLFRGSQQFKHLFLRTGDPELLRHYQKHQSNKIVGQALGFAGVVTILVGLNTLSSNNGTGWALVGTGFIGSVAGGYFTFQGQRQLQLAVQLFNQRNSPRTVGLGLGKQSAGLVYQF